MISQAILLGNFSDYYSYLQRKIISLTLKYIAYFWADYCRGMV